MLRLVKHETSQPVQNELDIKFPYFSLLFPHIKPGRKTACLSNCLELQISAHFTA